MKLEGLRSWVQTSALVVLAGAALVYALSGTARAEGPPSPGAECALFAFGVSSPAKQAEGLESWMDTKLASGRTRFILVGGAICAW